MSTSARRPNPVKPAPSIRIGIGGWQYAPWRDNFYPKGLVQRCELEYASRKVTAIEVNGTYYRAQQPATYAKWASETPDGFVFSLKAPMRITKARALAKTHGHVTDFLGGALSLGDRLGPILWTFEDAAPLAGDAFAAFVESLPATLDGRVLRHALDVRDPSALDAERVALAKRLGIALVVTESDAGPAYADVTGNFIYARLKCAQSRIATGYRPAQLAAWARRLRSWAEGGEPDDLPKRVPTQASTAPSRDVFAFFIGGDKVRNPAAAMALIKRISAPGPTR